jgi:lysozyme family protein
MSDPNIYIDFTHAREGGLSKAKTDSASKFPVPDGTGTHTNSGVTYKAYVELSSKLGYTPSVENFYKMIENGIWNKIYHNYWTESGADLIDSQAIANLIFQALWGGGHSELVKALQKFFSGALKVDGQLGRMTATKVNEMTAKSTIYEKMLMEYLHNERVKYLKSLSAFKANGKGWMARMDKLYEFNRNLISAKR